MAALVLLSGLSCYCSAAAETAAASPSAATDAAAAMTADAFG